MQIEITHFTNNIYTTGTARYKVCFGVVLRLEGGEEAVPSLRLGIESFCGIDVVEGGDGGDVCVGHYGRLEVGSDKGFAVG